MSPEVLRCPLKRQPGDNKDRADLHYATAVDAWAVGVLAFELLTGRCVLVVCAKASLAAASICISDRYDDMLGQHHGVASARIADMVCTGSSGLGISNVWSP